MSEYYEPLFKIGDRVYCYGAGVTGVIIGRYHGVGGNWTAKVRDERTGEVHDYWFSQLKFANRPIYYDDWY